MTKEEDQKQRQEQQEVDPQKVEQFISKVINDLGATSNVALAFIGDKLGLYKAMAQATTSGSIGIKPHELASLTNTNERYIREWLAEQVCGGYIIYDSKTGTYSLPKEHAIALTDESSPAYVAGAFQLVMSALKIEPKVTEAFRTGGGFDWNEHDPGFFEGQARFSTPNYKANLVTNWIPSLEGVEQKLSQGGAKVADIGCGFGASTMIMAKAYPNSTFYGFDYHAPSVESARKQVEKEALTEDRVKFEVGSATNFNGSSSADGSGSSGGYDLITFFDCFHDMPDPYSVAKHARNALKADGTCMIVEIASNDTLEENVNSPLGRIGYTGSIFVCVPTALGQIKSDSSSTSSANNNTVLLPLGAMPGISKIEKIMKESGFSRFKCTFNNGFNMVLEARP
jgi:cyclopropane fatty-acyl-phospholipid synthase-like methyltransferase